MQGSPGLTLGELLGAACGVQTDLLAFDFACVTRHEASTAEVRLERRVVIDQRAGDGLSESQFKKSGQKIRSFMQHDRPARFKGTNATRGGK